VRAESRVEREFLAAHEHIDRIDLDQPDVLEHPPKMPPVDPPRRPRDRKSLSPQRKTPSLRSRELKTSYQGSDNLLNATMQPRFERDQVRQTANGPA
jgi:hypothetical protein